MSATQANLAEIVDDLKDVYTLAIESTIDPSYISDLIDRINVRYARELLAVLTRLDLLKQVEESGSDFWQTANEYDDGPDREETALADFQVAIDAAMPQAPATSSARKGVSDSGNTYTAVGTPCLCGCGESTGKSNYKPGHDARHAGQIGRAIAANYGTKGFDRRELLDALPSDKLKAKAEGIAEKQMEKNPPRPYTEGVITRKVSGKPEEYPARKDNQGNVTYKYFDEWTKAGATIAKTFKEA